MKNGKSGCIRVRSMPPARRTFALLLVAACVLVFLPARAHTETSGAVLLDTRWNDEEGRIPTPTDLRECLDECEYKKGREDEACVRKRDPIERKKCFAEAMQRYADCKRECHKKYPEK